MTFLFTDIEGSTRRWEADAESMRASLFAHDEVLRTAIESHDGFLFSHTGDGVVAAFASPKAAVDAAITAQRTLELPVRMGIATGEAELRDGDYFGTVLNRAARVMAAGHGGQILVADSTAGLLSGVELVSLGPRRLRDLPNPIAIFQLAAPGLQSDFPPLRTIDSSQGNLRPAASRLIGREADVDGIASAVRSHRLVTLTGVGGVGKTRLSLEVASALADEFPDGVWVFELASVVDPAAVPDAVAAVLGITQQPGMTMRESVAATLEGRIRLLVFDNCEHLVDAVADLVESILAQSKTVKILSTSPRRSDDHCRYCRVRIRPNRSSPSRTRTITVNVLETLTVGAAFPDPPFNGMPDNTGLDIDLMTAIANALGAQAEFIAYEGRDFNGIFDGLGSAYDCVAAGTTVTPERETKAQFVSPYLISGQSLAVDTARLPHVKSIDNLDGLTIGVQQGNTSQPIADRLVADGKAAAVRLYDYGAIRSALTDLTTGACDAFMKLAPVLTELVKPISGVEVVQRGISVENIAIAVGLDDQALLARIIVAQEELEQDGTLQRIRRKWLGNPYADQSLTVH